MAMHGKVKERGSVENARRRHTISGDCYETYYETGDDANNLGKSGTVPNTSSSGEGDSGEDGQIPKVTAWSCVVVVCLSRLLVFSRTLYQDGAQLPKDGLEAEQRQSQSASTHGATMETEWLHSA